MKAIDWPSGDHVGEFTSRVSEGERFELFARDIEEVEACGTLRQVANHVLFELVPVHHNRLGSAATRSGGTAGRGAIVLRVSWIAIGHHEQQLLAVGRPVILRQAALHICKLLCLAAGPIEQPDLSSLCLPGTAGEK